MNESAPKGGAGSDDSRSGSASLAGTARAGHRGRCVRTGSSCAERIDSNAPAATGRSRSQSEGDLDLPEAAGRRAEGRPSGKSDGKRSDRRETTGGAVVSAGWREVADQLSAWEGQRHE